MIICFYFIFSFFLSLIRFRITFFVDNNSILFYFILFLFLFFLHFSKNFTKFITNLPHPYSLFRTRKIRENYIYIFLYYFITLSILKQLCIQNNAFKFFFTLIYIYI